MKKIAAIFLAVFLMTTGYCLAEEDEFLFKGKAVYNIYLNGEYRFVIRDVEIIDKVELNGHTFLIIKPSGFSSSDDLGYISFKSVSAILPREKYRVEMRKNLTLFRK